jgi:flagellar hook-associated protein 1 FlgK
MAGLLGTLGSAANALDVQSEAITVVSNNIANVNNPDYSEETTEISDRGMVETQDGPASMGVAATVSQDRSAVLDKMVQEQDSLVSSFTAQQAVLQQAQAALGENISSSSSTAGASTTINESGLSSSIDSFFNAFENLAANPTDAGAKQTVIAQAGVLTDRFQEVDQNLAQTQSDADAQVTSGVTAANSLLQQVATLNTQIAACYTSDPGSAASLVDQREGDLEQLAAIVPVTVQEDARGEDTVSVSAGSGSVALVTSGAVTNSLSYAAGTLSAGSTAIDPSSGSLAGLITASTGPVQTLRNSLDALASQIVTAVNGAYNPSGPSSGDFFASSGTTAGTIAVNSGITSATLQAGTGSAGDNSLAVAVANVANQQFSTSGGDDIDGTIDGFYSGAASDIGQALDTANTQVTDQTAVQTIVNNQRSSYSGVSLNDEMSKLLTYQTAYQASSELFATINNMLSVIITDLTSAT